MHAYMCFSLHTCNMKNVGISNSTIPPLLLDFILFLMLLRLFLNKLAGFFKVPRNPIPWLVSALVETETGQSSGSCMPCLLS